MRNVNANTDTWCKYRDIQVNFQNNIIRQWSKGGVGAALGGTWCALSVHVLRKTEQDKTKQDRVHQGAMKLNWGKMETEFARVR